MAKRLEITISDGVDARLEAARGHEPRASFVKRALESALDRWEPASLPGPPVDWESLDPRRDRVAVALEARSASASVPYLSCPVPGCTFKARSSQAKCSVHGRTVR